MQALLDRGLGHHQGARRRAQARRDMSAARLGVAEGRPWPGCAPATAPEEKDAARARVAAAEARIAQLEQQLKDATVIVSPLAGVVTEKIAEAGELLQAGAPLCVVTNLADAWLTVYVPEADLGRIRIGQAARGHDRRRPEAHGPRHLRRVAGRVHAQERADPGRAGEARLQGQDRRSTTRTASSSPACPRKPRLEPRPGAGASERRGRAGPRLRP